MSDGARTGAEPLPEPAADLLAGAPETAYFWGHVAGGGEVRAEALSVTTEDEAAAEALVAIAGVDADDLERERTSRGYAHDASITRTEETDTLEIEAADGRLFGRASTRGFPVDARGNYRFDAFRAHERELLRGLLESCGTVCFKSSSGTVGVSFVHDDRALLETVADLLADCPVEAPTGDIAETSSGGYWFGLEDAAAPAFGTWVYEGSEERGLYAPSRRRKLRRSLEEADAYGGADRSDADAG